MGRSSRNFLIPLFISSEIITIFLHSTAQQGGNCTKCCAFKSDITTISENQTTQDHPMQCYIYEKQNKIKSQHFPVVSMFIYIFHLQFRCMLAKIHSQMLSIPHSLLTGLYQLDHSYQILPADKGITYCFVLSFVSQ